MARRTARPKPLIRVRKPVKAAAYRARVKPFDSLRFLDVRALARAARARVEIGTIETPAGSATVVAEIRRGQVVGLKARACTNGKRVRRVSDAKMKQVVAQVGAPGGVTLPVPVARMFGPMGLRIPIGPIVIVIGEPDMTFCIEWTREDGTICWWCLFDASGCMGMGPPS